MEKYGRIQRRKEITFIFRMFAISHKGSVRIFEVNVGWRTG
jgi:hypothetical protein